MQKALPQALQGVQAPLRFAVGLMHCRGACRREGGQGGRGGQSRAGQAKEIAEAAEELYREPLRGVSSSTRKCVAPEMAAAGSEQGVDRERGRRAEAGGGCHKQEHRTHIKAAGARAGAVAGAAAAVAFNVYFACQGT